MWQTVKFQDRNITFFRSWVVSSLVLLEKFNGSILPACFHRRVFHFPYKTSHYAYSMNVKKPSFKRRATEYILSQNGWQRLSFCMLLYKKKMWSITSHLWYLTHNFFYPQSKVLCFFSKCTHYTTSHASIRILFNR